MNHYLRCLSCGFIGGLVNLHAGGYALGIAAAISLVLLLHAIDSAKNDGAGK